MAESLNGRVAAYLASQADGNEFRNRAFKKAATTVAAAPPFYDDSSALSVLDKLVSPKMMDHVSKAILSAVPAHLEEGLKLTKVSCIGIAKAKKLINVGITTLDQLRDRPDLLTSAQRTCLKYHEDIIQRIPRSEMTDHDSVIHAAALRQGLDATVVGSYRRGAESSGDIDVILKETAGADGMSTFLAALQAYLLPDQIACGPHKFMGVCRLAGRPVRRLDVLCTPPAMYPFALMHFTGPAEFNIALRKRAISRGMKLSERGLSGSDRSFDNEADILAFLGVAWTAPCDRSGTLAEVPPPGSPGRAI